MNKTRTPANEKEYYDFSHVHYSLIKFYSLHYSDCEEVGVSHNMAAL